MTREKERVVAHTLFFGIASFISFGWSAIITFGACVLVLVFFSMNIALLASLMVTSLMVLSILGLVGILTGGFYVEGKRIMDSIISYLENEQVQVCQCVLFFLTSLLFSPAHSFAQKLLTNHESSPIYLWLLEKFEYFGFNTSLLDPVYLQEEARSLAYSLAKKSDVLLDGARKGISFASDTVFSIVLFFTSFIYFLQVCCFVMFCACSFSSPLLLRIHSLQQKYNQSVRSAIKTLSPFSNEVTDEVFRGLEKSWIQIVLVFLIVGEPVHL